MYEKTVFPLDFIIFSLFNKWVYVNFQGRVLYDIIIYNVIKDNGSPHYLIECDQSVAKEMLKKLKVYKIRKKVSKLYQKYVGHWCACDT